MHNIRLFCGTQCSAASSWRQARNKNFRTTDEADTAHVVSKLPTARKPWLYLYITPCVKCAFTHASRAEIRILTPRDIKFRTILVRKTFPWRLWLHHSPSARVANSHSPEKVLSHSYRNVLFLPASFESPHYLRPMRARDTAYFESYTTDVFITLGLSPCSVDGC